MTTSDSSRQRSCEELRGLGFSRGVPIPQNWARLDEDQEIIDNDVMEGDDGLLLLQVSKTDAYAGPQSTCFYGRPARRPCSEHDRGMRHPHGMSLPAVGFGPIRSLTSSRVPSSQFPLARQSGLVGALLSRHFLMWTPFTGGNSSEQRCCEPLAVPSARYRRLEVPQTRLDRRSGPGEHRRWLVFPVVHQETRVKGRLSTCGLPAMSRTAALLFFVDAAEYPVDPERPAR